MKIPGLKAVLDLVVPARNALERVLVGDDDDVVLEDFEISMQGDDYTCGAQSAFMVLRWFGRARSAGAVAASLGTTDDGTSDAAIARLLRARGLRVRPLTNGSFRDLEKALRAESPVLVYLDDEHYAVVYGLSATHVYLADPSLVRAWRSRVPRKDFRRRWGPERWGLFVAKPPARARRRR